ncbi:MAG: hypothetical protein HY360_25930 [Verrucomicrobia bacterium]|nr:hypothetical protein [Verrucomicrobiota bacterium]
MPSKSTMTSRERILAAAERKRTDRPPISLRCTPEAWTKLRQHLGVSTNQEALDTLDVDMRWLDVPFIGPKERSTPTIGGEGTDAWGISYKKVSNPFNTYYEFATHPLANARTISAVENYDWPSLDWWDYSAIPGLIDRINCKEPRGIIFFCGGAFETPWYLRGLETFLMDLREQPDLAEAISRRVQELYLQRAMRAVEAARGRIDVFLSGGDIGEQQRMLLNPDLWRRRIKPYSAKLITTFKRLGFKTFYHSDGAIVPVIPDFIEMGLDFLDPIQVTASGMKPEELFPMFGDRLSFHGAIDEVHLLPRATPDEVYRETVRTIDVLGQRGGYVVSASHAVQGDTPPENVVAMFRAARDYRWA